MTEMEEALKKDEDGKWLKAQLFEIDTHIEIMRLHSNAADPAALKGCLTRSFHRVQEGLLATKIVLKKLWMLYHPEQSSQLEPAPPKTFDAKSSRFFITKI